MNVRDFIRQQEQKLGARGLNLNDEEVNEALGYALSLPTSDASLGFVRQVPNARRLFILARRIVQLEDENKALKQELDLPF